MELASAQDVQAGRPRVGLALSRVGVLAVHRLVIIAGEPLDLRLECSVDLPAGQRGAHMSRFETSLDEALAEATDARRPDLLAARVAELARASQDARRAEVTVEARHAEERETPGSAIATEAIATLLASAVAREDRPVRHALGVRAQGMTACPCAQEAVAANARERLAAHGFDDDQIEVILADVPVATHNQRGIGTLHLASPGALPVDAAELLRIVEDAMSSEVLELLKRGDEATLVEKAHRRPRFVEDCVREMLGAVAALPGLPDDAFVLAHQRNLETIHRHDVQAERSALLGDLRDELATGERTGRAPALRDWLDAG